MMFQHGLFFLPLVCFAVGMQVPTPEVKYAAGSNDGPLTPANECDFYSCNDLVYELAARNGQRVQLGQCSSPAGGADNYFCYVNEDSSCEKKQTDLGWVSFEPCKAGNAVGTRAFSWQGLWDWAKGAIDSLVTFILPEFSVDE